MTTQVNLLEENVAHRPVPAVEFSQCTVNGDTLNYLDAGQGPVVLFLHGALTDACNWLPVITKLSNHYRCIAPTLPLGGHQIAVSSKTDLSVEGIANLLLNFLNKLNISQCHMVGNDTGGVYAKMYVHKNRESVLSLTLSNCDAFDVFPPKAFSTLPTMVKVPAYTKLMALLFRSEKFIASTLAMGLLSDNQKPSDQKSTLHGFRYNAQIRQNFSQVAQNWNSRITQQLAEDLASFQKPVCILWGEEDVELFPIELGNRLANVFPNAEFQSIPQAKTYVHWDQPDVFSKLLRQFLNNLET